MARLLATAILVIALAAGFYVCVFVGTVPNSMSGLEQFFTAATMVSSMVGLWFAAQDFQERPITYDNRPVVLFPS